ncbi:MAG: acyl-CoA dehydrogenase family protein [Sinimarinibacterium sp.]|jgi:acyl-CoA dehydrogenase
MNLDFSAEQETFRTQLQRLLDERGARQVARRLASATAGFDGSLWSALADLGALGAHLPEAYGGFGGQRLDLCVVAEELGRTLAAVPALATLYLYSELLFDTGDEQLLRRVLPELVAGRMTGTVAFTEVAGSAVPLHPTAVLRDGRLWGAKTAVADGADVDAAIVLAADGTGSSLCWVDMHDTAVHRSRLPSLDLVARPARLDFQGARAVRLGPAGGGHALLQRALDRAAVYVAFEQIGGAAAMLEKARDHALQRFAFGRPIGALQAIKHRLADLFVATELARSNCYYGAWAVTSGSDELPLAAAAARVSAGSAFETCAAECIQIHGALGFTWESDCHLYYRRAKGLAVALGSEFMWKERLMSHLDRQAA